MSENLILCLGREFGSGGHDIGELVAKQLGIAYYSKEILRQAASESGIVEEMFEQADEKPQNSLLYSLSLGANGSAPAFLNYNDYLTNDKLFSVQSDVIRQMAEKGDCLIVGRCADYILRGEKRRLSIFVHASLELRIQRIARVRNLSEDAARALVKKTDKSRANYYEFYTQNNWGSANTYDLCLDSGRLGPDACAQIICAAARQL